MIDKIKRKRQTCAQLDRVMHTACALSCVQYTHIHTLDDGLANTAGSLSRDLQHTISCKHRTRYKLTHTQSEHSRLFTTAVRKQCLLVVDLQIWTWTELTSKKTILSQRAQMYMNSSFVASRPPEKWKNYTTLQCPQLKIEIGSSDSQSEQQICGKVLKLLWTNFFCCKWTIMKEQKKIWENANKNEVILKG